MDFAPPPDRDNFQTEDGTKAIEKGKRIQRALKKYGIGHRVSQHYKSEAIIKFGLKKYKI